MRKSTVFPLISLLILTAGVITCFLGHCNNARKIVSVVAGILYVIGGEFKFLVSKIFTYLIETRR